jgi:hypothetical protein
MLNPTRSTKRLLSLWSIPALLLAAPALAEDDPAVSADAADGDAEDADADDEEEEEEDPNAFPLSANIELSTALGSGFLPPVNPDVPHYLTIPSFSQSMTPALSYRLPTFDDMLPKMSLSTNMDVSIEWLSTYYGGVYDSVPRVSDLRTGLSFPGLYTEEVTGLSLGASLGWRAPLSLPSRRWNVLSSFSAGGSVSWNTGKLEFMPEWLGTFNVAFAPSIAVTAHSQNNPSIPCDSSAVGDSVLRRGDAVEQLDRIPLVFGTTAGQAVNAAGECILPGRRSWASASAGLSAGWSLKKHSVSLGLGLRHSYLAPNKSGTEFRSPYASPEDRSEITTGSLAYSYSIPTEFMNLPIDTNASFTAGVSSGQPAWNWKNQQLRFPLWDFVTPSNNFSAAFVALSVGI